MSKEEIKKQNAEQAAFPTELKLSNSADKGLTKREYFASMAMQEFVSSCGSENTNKWIAEQSVDMADKLLKQLKK